MQDHPVLSVASRKLVYECVAQNPGAHLRDVARRCRVPLGTALYHLDALDSAGLVSTRRDGRYKRYFAVAQLGRHEKDLLSMLRHATPRRIVLALLAGPPMTQRELCAALRVSRSTLSFHVGTLVASGLLARSSERPEGRYALVDPDAARAIALRFRDSLGLPGEAALFDALAPAPAAPAEPAPLGVA